MFDGCIYEDFPWNHYVGGAGLVSTLHDYGSFAKMLLNRGRTDTISFAQEELRRYCLQMDPVSQVDIAILPMPETMRDKLLEGKKEAQCDAFAADIVKGKGTL